MADPRRIPDWGWTVVLGVATALAFGLLFAVGPTGPAASMVFPVATLVIGLGGGLLARRAADLLGVLGGTVLAFEAVALAEVAQHGGARETLTVMFGIALIPGGFAAIVGMVVVGIRRLVRGAGARAVVLRGAAIVAVFAGLTWLYVLVASRPSPVYAYRVTGEREIVVTVLGGNATWCRVTSVTESDAEVRVGAACVSLILAPTTAVGIPTELAVHLSRPVGDRVVRAEGGLDVPLEPGRATGSGAAR